MNWYTGVLRRYADFSGRAHRTEYWMFILIHLVVTFGLMLVDGIVGTFVLALIYGLATIVPSIAVGARRLHDTGKSGWWLLLNLVPFGFIVLLVFFVMDSQPGVNKYGPNPKEAAPQPAAV